MSFLRHVFRRVGTLPPEPLPDSAQIPRTDFPSVIKELVSNDGRFAVLLSIDGDGIFRGHSFAWFTHADDDVWSAFWIQRDLGIITRDIEVVQDEAQRRIETYEMSLR
jgi:hypothetical protein